MSPHDIAGPMDQSSPNLGNKCQLARSLMLPNFIALQQKIHVRDIRCRKSVLPEKVAQSSPKSLRTWYTPMSLTLPKNVQNIHCGKILVPEK